MNNIKLGVDFVSNHYSGFLNSDSTTASDIQNFSVCGVGEEKSLIPTDYVFDLGGVTSLLSISIDYRKLSIKTS